MGLRLNQPVLASLWHVRWRSVDINTTPWRRETGRWAAGEGRHSELNCDSASNYDKNPSSADNGGLSSLKRQSAVIYTELFTPVSERVLADVIHLLSPTPVSGDTHLKTRHRHEKLAHAHRTEGIRKRSKSSPYSSLTSPHIIKTLENISGDLSANWALSEKITQYLINARSILIIREWNPLWVRSLFDIVAYRCVAET